MPVGSVLSSKGSGYITRHELASRTSGMNLRDDARHIFCASESIQIARHTHTKIPHLVQSCVYAQSEVIALSCSSRDC